MSERTTRILFGALAAYHLALGLLMVVAPKVFFEQIGPFGVRNDHYIRDVATFYLAFGAGLALAVRRPRREPPGRRLQGRPGLARAGRRDRSRAGGCAVAVGVARRGTPVRVFVGRGFARRCKPPGVSA